MESDNNISTTMTKMIRSNRETAITKDNSSVRFSTIHGLLFTGC